MHSDDAVDTGRWMVSYADFITLLFAFFVVMYSISSVNDGKFRVLSDSLLTGFNERPHRPVPIDLGGSAVPAEPISTDTLQDTALDEGAVFEPLVKPFDLAPGTTVHARVVMALAPLLAGSAVILRDGPQWLEVDLPSELLFASGRADLSLQAAPILNSLARALRGVKTPIHVEGFTDNVPLTGGRFGSNWQLSAARAAAVVDRFSGSGIDPKLLSAIGFGEFHPVAENDSEQGRNKNRRVVVAIAKHRSVVVGGPVAEMQMHVESVPSRTLQRVTRLPSSLGIL